MIRYFLILFLICSCAAIEEPDEKWKIAAEYLPREKLQGLVHAGFFEINDSQTHSGEAFLLLRSC